MKKIAVFSDIHGNIEALKCILNDIAQKNFDETFFLGDAISYGPDSKACLDLLREKQVNFIIGNHELYCLYGTGIDPEITTDQEREHYEWVKSTLVQSDLDYLKTCDLYREYIIISDRSPNQKLLFSHFLIADETAPYPFATTRLKHNKDAWIKQNEEYKYIFIGHDHEIYGADDIDGVAGNFEKTTGVKSNLWLLGSSGCTKNDQTTYTEIKIDDTNVNSTITVNRIFLTYDRKRLLEKIAKRDYPDKENIMRFAYGIDDKQE